MTFTYDLSSLVGRLRLAIGDTEENAGVRPDGSNLTDEEIAVWLAETNDNLYQAAALACDALARVWARVADVQIGPRREALGKVSAEWARQAALLRQQHGGAGIAFSGGPKRADGFADVAGEGDYG